MNLTEDQIEKIAPKPTAFKAGKKLSGSSKWDSFSKSDRGIWGAIRGSGKNPYLVQIDFRELAYKCTCPSRQFPCKHALGLLLLHAHEEDQFKTEPEPDYVEEWLNKRSAKAEKVEKVEKELTEEDIVKREKAKAKRDQQREEFVKSGVSELKLWLTDLVRLGLLDLPNIEYSYFSGLAARMVDAKAPGLAGWVRALGNLNYRTSNLWQEQAIEIIGKLYLLLQAYENIDQYDEVTQSTIKSLVGWTVKTKELEQDPKTLTIKDQWLVLGSNQQELEDNLTIHRNWLQGINSNQSALILTFETSYSPIQTVQLVDGAVINAELAFYPDILPHRAFIKNQDSMSQSIETLPTMYKNWTAQHLHLVEQMKKNPWLSYQSYLVENLKIVSIDEQWYLCDQNKNIALISPNFSNDKLMKSILIGNYQANSMAIVRDENGVIPLGMFTDNKYIII